MFAFEANQASRLPVLDVIFWGKSDFCCWGFPEKGCFQQSSVISLLIWLLIWANPFSFCLSSYIGIFSIVILKALFSRWNMYAVISKKEQAKKEEAWPKDGKITRINYWICVNSLFIHTLALPLMVATTRGTLCRERLLLVVSTFSKTSTCYYKYWISPWMLFFVVKKWRRLTNACVI